MKVIVIQKEELVSLSTGYVLNHPERNTVLTFQILGCPCHGMLLFPGRDARQFAFTWDSILHTYAGAVPGQGILAKYEIDFEKTDPSLAKKNWSGAFLCSGPNPIVATEFRCSFQMGTIDALAFNYASDRERADRAAGRMIGRQLFEGETIQVGVWYPIELSIPGREAKYENTNRNFIGFAFGVIRFSSLTADLNGEGVLRFVYEENNWDPSACRFNLHRWGRQIGTVECKGG